MEERPALKERNVQISNRAVEQSLLSDLFDEYPVNNAAECYLGVSNSRFKLSSFAKCVLWICH